MYDIKYMQGARINLLEIEKNLDAKDTRLADKILQSISERIQSLQEMQCATPNIRTIQDTDGQVHTII